MAKMHDGPGDGLRGQPGGLSYYKMRGVKETIVREKGGHTKAKVKNLMSPENYPYYSLVVSLGVMPDLFWNKIKYLPASLKYLYGAAHAAYSEGTRYWKDRRP